MLGEIIIDELQDNAIIGCLDEERNTKQPLIISLAIQYDMQDASETDDITKALNYAQISKDIKNYTENSNHYILESLAKKILTIIFYYPQAKQVSLFIYKPNAIDYTKRVGIKIMQKRNQKETTQKTSLTTNKLDWD